MLLTEDSFEKIRDKSKWPPNASNKEATEDEPMPEYYLEPKVSTTKVIDFGGATFTQDYHGSIINTRQYRAPEVILQCCEWNEKSDIWSAACILAELYTGEMLFATHDSVEHLALITKMLGQFPKWMASNASKEFRDCFVKASHDDPSALVLNWPKCAPGEDTIKNYESAKGLDVIYSLA